MTVYFEDTPTLDFNYGYNMGGVIREDYAPINDGSSEEFIQNIDADALNTPISKLISELQTIRLKADRKHIIGLWDMAKTKMGMPLPDKPIEPFIQFVIKQLYDDTVKTGEKITLEYYAKCFALGLENFYGIHLK